LGLARGCARVRPPIFRNIEPDALQLLLRVEIAWPLPDGDGEIDAVILCRNAHLLAATPCNRTDIGIGEPLLYKQRIGGLVNLFGGIRNAKTENPPGFMKPFRVLAQFEDLAAIGALAFEYSAGI